LPPVNCSLLLVDIFLELITNACKALQDSDQQQLHVRTRLDQDDAGAWIIAEIKDTGRGISPEQMTHLWNMFQQSENGLGFGLWWLRTFIERQGGSINCHSEPDKGSTFVVRLPAVVGRQSSI
jgi:signal transduction histidine kinase